MPERGCGMRKKGGLYLVVATSPFGRPVEEFLFDPPIPFEPRAKVGVQIVPSKRDPDVYDVIDWVGAGNYPNVADFVEEGKRLGFSRLLSPEMPKHPDFAKIGPRSRLLVCHERAVIENAADYRVAWRDEHAPVRLAPRGTPVDPCPLPPFPCPQAHEAHRCHDFDGCAGLWWEDVEGGEPTGNGREVKRTIGSTTYRARARPHCLIPFYAPGLFAALPIGGFEIVCDPDQGTHQTALDGVTGRTALPIDLVDE